MFLASKLCQFLFRFRDRSEPQHRSRRFSTAKKNRPDDSFIPHRSNEHSSLQKPQYRHIFRLRSAEMVSGTSLQNPDFGISQNSQNPGHGNEVGRSCALQPRDEKVKEKYQPNLRTDFVQSLLLFVALLHPCLILQCVHYIIWMFSRARQSK
jgi:hypothetical protein